ncbi:unnamed protein product [Oppiella nova]|uniref:Serine aminopeptidase S33 domain-containing protein n=1 Tax=Oppiella nova TaxID=334625 RepID=A0A7R9M631_9ACAR|nr:unnamed protein product [Oppiella nova]CAG2171449.1 unnamed protein product [Oppiella nova]
MLKHSYCPPFQILPRIVSNTAFRVPDPSYDFQFDKKLNRYKLVLKGLSIEVNRLLLGPKCFRQFVSEMHLFEVFYAETRRDGRIACIFWSSIHKTEVTLLYSHNNSADMGYTSGYLWQMSRKLKCNFITYDYSGFGLSDGSPSEQNLYSDIDSALSCLMRLYNIWPKTTILFGESIGSVPTIDLSTRLQFKGVILESPILSGLRTLSSKYTTRFWAFDPFPNLWKADKIKCKVLIFHGTCDQLVDIKEAILLYNRFPHKVDPFWAQDYDHNVCKFHPKYYDRINTFITYSK